MAKRAALRKKANLLKKELREKDTKYEGLLSEVNYDESNPFQGEVIEKKPEIEQVENNVGTIELVNISELPEEDNFGFHSQTNLHKKSYKK